MNRLVTDNPAAITSEQLPEVRTRGAGGSRREGEGRARLLFLTSFALGFKTLTRQLENYTATRDDVEAVHVRLTVSRGHRLFGAGLKPLKGWDFPGYRHLLAWDHRVRRLFAGPLDPARFDAVLVSTAGLAGGMPAIRRRSGLPFGVYIDATGRQYSDELQGPVIPEGLVRRGERRIFNAASFVAGMSRWAIDSVARDYGVAGEKLLVVPNAVPMAASIPARVERRPGEKIRLVFVGNDWDRKGGPRLLAWHQAHWTERAELHVISASAPIDRSATSVVWHGSVPYDKLMGEVLPGMDIFAMPTRQDMSPWAAIEAAGLGLPVVSSQLGALGEIVVDGQTGLLFPPMDDAAFIKGIERLMGDAELRRSMSAAARAHALANFDPARSYGLLIDRMIVSGREGGGAGRGS